MASAWVDCVGGVFGDESVVFGLREKGLRLANFGYLGHMWELYAMWTWIPLFLAESFRVSNRGTLSVPQEQQVALLAFAVIGIGGVSSFLSISHFVWVSFVVGASAPLFP